MVGSGVVVFVNGSSYEGQWVNGVRTGRGIFNISNRLRYEGDFVNNQF